MRESQGVNPIGKALVYEIWKFTKFEGFHMDGICVSTHLSSSRISKACVSWSLLRRPNGIAIPVLRTWFLNIEMLDYKREYTHGGLRIIIDNQCDF